MSDISRLPYIPAAELDRALRRAGVWRLRADVQRPGEATWKPLDMWITGFNTEGETPDQPISQFKLLLMAHAEAGATVSPGFAAVPDNRNAGGGYEPMLYAGVHVRVYASNTATLAEAPVWRLWQQGRVETVRWPAGQVELTLTSPDAELDRAWVKSSGEVRGAPQPGVPLATEVQSLLDLWADAPAPVLRVLPDATLPDYASLGVGEYLTSRRSLGPFVREWAHRVGADLRYLWSEADQGFRLTLYMPPRDDTVPRLVLDRTHVLDVPDVKVERRHVRNDFELEYPVGTAGDTVLIGAEDAVSQRMYGRAYMYLGQGTGSPISDNASATAMLDFAAHDLAHPPVEAVKRLPFLPWLTLHDVLQFLADDEHFDHDGIWSVTSLRHVASNDDPSGWYTEVGLRKGSPVGLVTSWWVRPPRAAEVATREPVYLPNFDELGRDSKEVTYGWDLPVPNLGQVWVKHVLVDLETPIPAEGFWPGLQASPNLRIQPDQNRFVLAVPPEGKALYVTVEAYDVDGYLGAVYHERLLPVGMAPGFEDFDQRVGASGEFTDVYVTAWDPQDLGGTVYAWLNYDGPLSADTTLPADATLPLASTPAHLGPATTGWIGGPVGTMLDNIRTHAGQGKQIVLEFVNSQGVSSGKVAFTLTSKGGIINAAGDIVDAGIKRAAQFASGIAPVEVVDTIAQATGSLAVLPDGTLYRKNALTDVWTKAVAAVDISGQLTTAQLALASITQDLIAANAVTQTKIADGSISSPKILAGAVIAGKLGADAVLANNIAAGQITSSHIVSNAITANHIATGTITASELAANAVIAGKIAAGAINTSALIVNGVITGAHISVQVLSEIQDNMGVILAGKLQSIDGRSYLALNAADGSFFIRANNGVKDTFTVDHAGNAVYSGALSAATGTFAGEVSVGSSQALKFLSGASELARIQPFSGATPSGARSGVSVLAGGQTQLVVASDGLHIWDNANIDGVTVATVVWGTSATPPAGYTRPGTLYFQVS